MYNSVAVSAETLELLELSPVVLWHMGNMHVVVVNLNASLSDLSVGVGRIQFAAFAKEMAVLATKMFLLRFGQTGCALLLEMRDKFDAPLSPYTVIV